MVELHNFGMKLSDDADGILLLCEFWRCKLGYLKMRSAAVDCSVGESLCHTSL